MRYRRRCPSPSSLDLGLAPVLVHGFHPSHLCALASPSANSFRASLLPVSLHSPHHPHERHLARKQARPYLLDGYSSTAQAIIPVVFVAIGTMSLGLLLVSPHSHITTFLRYLLPSLKILFDIAHNPSKLVLEGRRLQVMDQIRAGVIIGLFVFAVAAAWSTWGRPMMGGGANG